jgi:hypothetical protein
MYRKIKKINTNIKTKLIREKEKTTPSRANWAAPHSGTSLF